MVKKLKNIEKYVQDNLSVEAPLLIAITDETLSQYGTPTTQTKKRAISDEERLKNLALVYFGKNFEWGENLPENLNSKNSKFLKEFQKEFNCSFDDEDYTIWEFDSLGALYNYIICRLW